MRFTLNLFFFFQYYIEIISSQLITTTLPVKTDRQVGGYYNGIMYLIGGNNVANGVNNPAGFHWEFNVSSEQYVILLY